MNIVGQRNMVKSRECRDMEIRTWAFGRQDTQPKSRKTWVLCFNRHQNLRIDAIVLARGVIKWQGY